jgi:hypothetical protein
MPRDINDPCTAFQDSRILLSGPLGEVAIAVKAASESGALETILVFDDTTGRVVDLDVRGTNAEVLVRLSQSFAGGTRHAPPAGPSEPRGRGRPRLGVVGREVTLLPRHWEWLEAQPGGASVTLRKLVEAARRAGGAAHELRLTRERAYRFMSAMAGDMAGFEEATRALFAGDQTRFQQHAADWPEDVRAYASRLAFGGGATAAEAGDAD